MANSFKIPDKFKIKGRTIKVVWDNERLNREGLLGEADFSELKITLCKTSRGRRLKKSEIEHTFFHELSHIALHLCDRHRLKWNEELVDDLGLCLMNFFKTRKPL